MKNIIFMKKKKKKNIEEKEFDGSFTDNYKYLF